MQFFVWVFLQTLNVVHESENFRVGAEDIERTRDEQPQDDTYYNILVRAYRMYKVCF